MKKHNAPPRCWIKHELGIVSPARKFTMCRYGQSNDPKKCKNCRHNKQEVKERESTI